VFLNPPHRETPKTVIKYKQQSRKKSVMDFFVDFLVKTFRQDFFVFRSVFEQPSRQNKKLEEKLTSIFLSIFSGKVFDMEFFQKKNVFVVCGLFGFWTSVTEKRQKNVLKKSQETNYLELVGSSKANQLYVGARRGFLVLLEKQPFFLAI
jgi:hypothetical protein